MRIRATPGPKETQKAAPEKVIFPAIHMISSYIYIYIYIYGGVYFVPVKYILHKCPTTARFYFRGGTQLGPNWGPIGAPIGAQLGPNWAPIGPQSAAHLTMTHASVRRVASQTYASAIAKLKLF